MGLKRGRLYGKRTSKIKLEIEIKLSCPAGSITRLLFNLVTIAKNSPKNSLIFNTKVKNYKFIIRVDSLTYSSFFHWCSNNMARNESEGKLNFGKKRQQIVSTWVQFFCVFLCTIPHQEKL